MSLLVFVERRNARIDYTFNLMLGSIAGIDFVFVEDQNYFNNSEIPKLSYGKSAIGDEIHIKSYGLLEEQGLSEQSIECVDYNGMKCPFPVDGHAEFPFDLFSAGFYLVTRYEEYTNKNRDVYGRFSAKDSLAYQQNFLDKPVIDLWALELRKIIQTKFPSIAFKKQEFRFISTIDIDQAYAYKARGMYRSLGGIMKNIITLNGGILSATLKALLGIAKDPFDTVDEILSLAKRCKHKLIFFIHLGDYGKYDKSIYWNHQLIKQLALKIQQSGAEVGLHPSYRSNEKEEILKEEESRFEKLFNRKAEISRQHYLKLNLPLTYHKLISHAFTADYTMGYADEIGFRAGSSRPFFFFDLNKESVTHLMIYPFCAMDRTLKDYMKLTPEQAMQVLDDMYYKLKDSEGIFLTLWHNESLSNEREWKGWKKVYHYICGCK